MKWLGLGICGLVILITVFCLGAWTFSDDRRPVAPPTCEDAISKLAALGIERLTVMTDGAPGAPYTALVKFRTPDVVWEVTGHGRTPQEAAARALKTIQPTRMEIR